MGKVRRIELDLGGCVDWCGLGVLTAVFRMDREDEAGRALWIEASQ